MPRHCEIRADFDRETIVVYQAYCPTIADPAVAAGRFVEPFSWNRMTWIKPSFLWLMVRSNWGRKPKQERTLAIRITRAGWEAALGEAVLTSFQPLAHGSPEAWRAAFDRTHVHVQWDPERSLRGRKLEHRSIQVGVGRDRIRRFTDDWIVEIRDLSDLVRRIRRHLDTGDTKRARQLLPAERVYRLPAEMAGRLGMET